jgi:hypothetical protein
VGAAVLLIVHRAPVRGLELELMAKGAFPIETPIVVVNTPAEAYQALDTFAVDVALLEETPDLIAFAAHADARLPGLVVGWVGKHGQAAPPLGHRLNAPIVQADLAALAAQALHVKRGS